MSNVVGVTTVIGACAAGLAGAAAIEAVELYGATKKVKEFPWRVEGEARLTVYVFSVVIRLGLGVFAAWVCAMTGPPTFAGAAAAGIAAPTLLEQMRRVSAPAESEAEAADPLSAAGGGLSAPGMQAGPAARPVTVTEGGSVEANSR